MGFAPPPTPGRQTRLAAALLLLVAVSGCRLAALQFTNDNRLRFTSPQPRHHVTTPLTVSWTMKDFTATGLDGSPGRDHGAYALFVDTAPMPAGKDLRWVFRNDTGCRRDPRCPDARQLADAGIYVTTETTVTVPSLPDLQSHGDEQHFVNVVLLDGTGHRIGESAWYLPFVTRRHAQ